MRVTWAACSGKASALEKSRVGMLMPSAKRKFRLIIMRVGSPLEGPAVANTSPDDGQLAFAPEANPPLGLVSKDCPATDTVA